MMKREGKVQVVSRRLVEAGAADAFGESPGKDAARRAVNTAMLLDEITRLTYVRGGADLGLRPAHWSALRYLAQTAQKARTAAAFARHYGLDRSGVNRLFRHLEDLGLVARVERGTVADARKRLIRLTEAGWEAMDYDPIGLLADVMQKELSDEALREFALTALQIAEGITGRSTVLTTHRARALMEDGDPELQEGQRKPPQLTHAAPAPKPARRRRKTVTPPYEADAAVEQRAREGVGYRRLAQEFRIPERKARDVIRRVKASGEPAQG